jgi:hypothetical protein
MVTDSSSPSETIAGYLSEVLGQPVQPTFRIGPARANRKPVLRLLNADGQTVAFAKVGISELTNSLVQGEALALAAAGHMQPQSFTAPTLLHHGQWHGLEVLVQSPLPIAAGPPMADDGRRVAAMVELATATGSERLALLTSPYWMRLKEAINFASDETARALAATLVRMEAALDNLQLDFGAWHGDWAPWNMALLPETLLLWDWERYEDSVPLGFDALHHHFQLIKSTMGADEAIRNVYASAADLLAPFNVDRSAAPAVSVLYATSLAMRYARDFAAMGSQTWTFPGSPMLAPLTRFVTTWEA